MVKLRIKERLLFQALLIFGLLHVYKCNGVDFLGVRQRFSDSSHYDYYYCCNICDHVLRWVVDGQEQTNQVSSQTEVGNVEPVHFSGNPNTLQYTSLILSKRYNGSHTCLDSVLIFTKDVPDQRPVVECRSHISRYTVNYKSISNTLIDVSNSSVTVRNTANSHYNVVSPGNNCSTQIVLCRTRGDFLRWNNGTSSALFNGISRAGSSQFQLHPLDSNIALWNAVILEKNEQFTTSAIIWTDFISAGSYHVNCESHTGEVATMINTPVIAETTLISMPTDTPSSTKPSVATSVSPSLVSVHDPLSYSVNSVVVALMMALCFSRT